MSNDWTKMWESKPTPKQEETKVRILPETEPNWQHYRIQAAIAIVQGWASTPQGLTKVCMAGAVELADALIAELKKGGE